MMPNMLDEACFSAPTWASHDKMGIIPLGYRPRKAVAMPSLCLARLSGSCHHAAASTSCRGGRMDVKAGRPHDDRSQRGANASQLRGMLSIIFKRLSGALATGPSFSARRLERCGQGPCPYRQGAGSDREHRIERAKNHPFLVFPGRAAPRKWKGGGFVAVVEPPRYRS